MSKKVLTVGEILVEIVATTKGDGFLEPQPLVGPFPSGAPAIFIDQIGRLGTPAAIISRVGDDDFGRLNVDRLDSGRGRRLGNRGGEGRGHGLGLRPLPT